LEDYKKNEWRRLTGLPKDPFLGASACKTWRTAKTTRKPRARTSFFTLVLSKKNDEEQDQVDAPLADWEVGDPNHE
jgi:hypothetical protein